MGIHPFLSEDDGFLPAVPVVVALAKTKERNIDILLPKQLLRQSFVSLK